MMYEDVLIKLSKVFKIDDDKVLFQEFISSFDEKINITKFELNYEAIEDIFKVKLDKSENFYLEFRKKVLRLYESPYHRYNKLKKVIDDQLSDIRKIVEKLELQILELEDREKIIKEEIDNLKTVIGKKNWFCEECNEEKAKLKEYTLELSPSINLKIKKCKQYKRYLNKEIDGINCEWNEKKIKKYSLNRYSIENIFIKFTDDLFDKETDYSINVKVAIHTRKLFEKLNNEISRMDKEKIDEYILEEKSKNKYSTELLESYYLNNKKKYYELLKNYIEEEEILEFIVNATKSNFFIAYRSEVIKDIKKLYENHSYQTCSCLIPLQIEGILYDYCEELGIVPDTLNNFTMGTKITEIDKAIDFYLDEYMNYNMQIIRNKIAHGILYEDDNENICIELILDLASLLYFLNIERKIYSNELREFLLYYKDKERIDWLAKNYKINNEFAKIRGYIFSDKIVDKRENVIKGRVNLLFSNKGREIANYYNCTNELLEVNKAILSEEFLQYYRVNEIDELDLYEMKKRIDNNKSFIETLLRKELGEEEKDILINCNKKLNELMKERLEENKQSKANNEIIINSLKNKLVSY
ncbi:MAG: hypothetical protein E6Y83_15910 [Clostridium butyricum]|nr:hypothetical protein [Clostridium butyricum]